MSLYFDSILGLVPINAVALSADKRLVECEVTETVGPYEKGSVFKVAPQWVVECTEADAIRYGLRRCVRFDAGSLPVREQK